MVVGLGDAVMLVRETKKLCSAVKESRRACRRVQSHLETILNTLEEMEKEHQILPSDKFFVDFKNTMEEFKKYLQSAKEKKRHQAILGHQGVLKELQNIEHSVDRLFQMLGLKTVGLVADIHRQTVENTNILADMQQNSTDYSRIIADVQQRMNDNFLAIVDVQQTAHDIALNLQRLHNKYEKRLPMQPPAMKSGQSKTVRRIERKASPAAVRAALNNAMRPGWLIRASDVKYELEAFDHGPFGPVHRGVHLPSGSGVVVKLLHCPDPTPSLCERGRIEISRWHMIDHPHVVKLVGMSPSSSPPFIVCKEASSGNLANFLARSTISRGRLWRLLYEASLGLQCIHDKQIVHGCLKLNNILVDASGHAKISNLGFSSLRRISAAASEHLGDDPTFASDVYSFAMCIFEAVSGSPPLSSAEIDGVDDDNLLETMNETTKELFLAMTEVDPGKRPSLSQVTEKLKEFADHSRVENSPGQQQLIHCVRCSKAVPRDNVYSSACKNCFVQATNGPKPKHKQARHKETARKNAAKAPVKFPLAPAAKPTQTHPKAVELQQLVLRQRPKTPGDRSYVVDDWARCKPKGGTGYYALELAKFRKHMLPAKFALQCRECNMNVVNGLFQGTQRPRNCRVCGELFCSECLKDIRLSSAFGPDEKQSCCTECQTGLRDKTIATVEDVFAQRNDRVARFDLGIDSCRIPRNQVILRVLVSRGQYLELYKGTYKHRDVAISMLPRTHYAGLGADAFLNTVIQVSKLDHPRIVRFFGVAWNSLDDLCAVSEFVSGGNLRTLLFRFKARGHPKGFDKIKVRIALQVAQALAFMHSLHITHDDIRPESVLLTAQGNAKLTNFHRCPPPRHRENVDLWLAEALGGHPEDRRLRWKAPELLSSSRIPVEFGKPDMFAFGVLLSELDRHTLAYESAEVPASVTRDEMFGLIMSGKLRHKFSAQVEGVHYSRFIGTMAEVVTSLAKACVSNSPSVRPTAAAAVSTLERALRMP